MLATLCRRRLSRASESFALLAGMSGRRGGDGGGGVPASTRGGGGGGGGGWRWGASLHVLQSTGLQHCIAEYGPCFGGWRLQDTYAMRVLPCRPRHAFVLY